MKVLVGLNLLQLVVIGFMLIKVTSLASQLDKQHASALAIESMPARGYTSTTDKQELFIDEAIYRNADFLRDIIRAEINASLEAHEIARLSNQNEEMLLPVNQASQIDQEKILEAQIELDNYLADGQISELDMATFQAKIASLDKQNRKEMLGKLVRALNSGELKGRL